MTRTLTGRRPRVRRPTRASILVWALALMAAGSALTGCGDRRATPGAVDRGQKAARYHCPMHPSYTSDRPGDCPICNMRLVPIPEGEATPDSGATPPTPTSGSTPAGRVPIVIEPEVAQRIGVELARAERGPATQVIRAAGRVTVDETRVHHVHTKVEGWVKQLYVDHTGQVVREGEPLVSLYSPDLVATQEEYLLARREGGESSSLAQSARRRLELWDVSDKQIQAIAASGEPKTHVDLTSHAAGVVLEKRVTAGMRVMPGEELYTIADLRRIWVSAAVYEYELPLVHQGQEASVTLAAAPGRVFRGRIVYLYPTLDPATRTAEVRLEFDNPDLLLKPGMFAQVEIQVPLGEALTIPASAVLDSGEEQVVLVAQGEGRYEPRTVTLGQRIGDSVVVLAGVEAGEEVVVGAHFLIDSESRLKAALRGLSGGHSH
jgi:Cu(I)/Ag(I) efflux system membrane fusion protein